MFYIRMSVVFLVKEEKVQVKALHLYVTAEPSDSFFAYKQHDDFEHTHIKLVTRVLFN